MPGHSYSGSSAGGNTGAVFPPQPFAVFDEGLTLIFLSVQIADSHAGRPTFEGYISASGAGNPTTNPGNWHPALDNGPSDTGTEYVETYEPDTGFFIGRARYGFNVSPWSPVIPAGF